MPTTDTAPQCTVGGGSGSTEAHFLDMRTTATRLDTSGDDARHLCTSVVRIGLSLPAKSAILSPGSALRITEQIATLTVDLGGLALRMEFVARTLRWSATAYELADATQRAAFAALTIATTPQRLLTDIALAATQASLEHPLPPSTGSRSEYGAEFVRNGKAWFDSFDSHLQQDVADDPALVDGAVAWTSFLTPVVSHSSPVVTAAFGPAPTDYEGQIGWLLASGRRLGWFADSKPLRINQTRSSQQPTKQRRLSDIVAQAAATEHESNSDHSVVHVRRVVGADGTGAWVVSIPGTTHWNLTSDHGPSSTAANLASMAGTKHALYPAIDKAMTAAMREAGVRPGSEPVMMAGHSQGGIVATRLAADQHFREKFDVTEVVTAGSPIGRIDVPKSVNVLSVENIHDPVPRADGVPNPDTTNRTNIVCETPKGERLDGLVDAHDASRYARSAAELTPDRGEGQLSQWYARNHRFLDGKDTDFTFQLRRP
ncbi:alpha/beta hydrolase family protein [Flexivirga lutea]